ncbi:MAG: archaeal flagellar protein FlaJ [Candidatus Micrarchaeota archaeon]|nr:MAG: archaeal flagellar protein FlaJ [Candidatus Micrarchaeota archaeon]
MVKWEALVSRNVYDYIDREATLAGLKRNAADRLISIMVISYVIIFVAVILLMHYLLKLNILISALVAVIAPFAVPVAIILILEYKIDQRKNKLEVWLPDFFSLTAANLKSGMSFDKALVSSARPEFSFFSDDVKEMIKLVVSGETMENGLKYLASKYRSYHLQHSVRMIIQSIRYGGSVSDLLRSIAEDIRQQVTTQREISSQLLIYSIFIIFAGVIVSPALFGLTLEMITIEDAIWKGILQSNPNGLPSIGASFIKPEPPQVTPTEYQDFAYVTIIIITGFASFIIGTINSGSPIKGLRFLPLFIILGLVIFNVAHIVLNGLFSSLLNTAGT